MRLGKLSITWNGKRKNPTKPTNKVVIIGMLENRPILDRIVTFFWKPIFIAVGYSLNQIMQFNARRTGRTKKPYYLELLQESVEEYFNKRGKDVVYYYWAWYFNAFTLFLSFDNAYDRMFRKILRIYTKKIEKFKYKL